MRRRYYTAVVDGAGNDTLAVKLGTIRQDLTERVPTASGQGYTTRRVGEEEVDLILEIDPAAVRRRLGRRAASSARGRAWAAGNAFLVRVTNRRR